MPFVAIDAFDNAPEIDRRTLTDSVYAHLREQLSVGGMRPGEKLSLRELGSEMGVSVMPVREAVNRLVAERALEVTAARVLRVPLINVQQIRDLCDIRVAVEGFAAERAAALRTQTDLDAIDTAADALDRMVQRTPGDAGGWIAMNRNLHFTIYRAARLPLLVKMIGDLWLRAGPVLNYDLRTGSQRHVTPDITRYHAEAVAAIHAGNPAAARLAIAGDILAAAAYIIRNGHWLTI